MTAIDVPKLLEPISAEDPAGPDLSYDPGFMELDQLVQGREGGGIVSTEDLPSEEPDYKEVRRRCIDLLQRTKHLRLGVYLTLAALKLDGPSGLRDGLAVLRGLVEHQWDHVHPKLDPEDDNDPTERLNIIVAMATPVGTYGDGLRFLHTLREAPLTDSRQVGRFSLRDIMVATGKAQPGENEKTVDAAMIEAAFKDTDPQSLQRDAQALEESIAHAQAIEQILTERVGVTQAIDLSNLANAIRELHQEVASRLPLSMQPTSADDSAAGHNGAGAPGTPPQPIAGEIASREDVVRMLDKICTYYARNEPSSPLPLILQRAKRLVHMDFMDILNDISPDSVQQVSTIMGIDSNT